MYDRILSLGATCTPTWQIRHRTGDEALFPLDWTTTTFDALIPLIDSNFAALTDVSAYRETADGHSIRNIRSDTRHIHDFPRTPDNRLAPNWRAALPLVQRKYEAAIDRWNDAVESSGSILFVRHQGHFDLNAGTCANLLPGDVEKLCVYLEWKYPRLAFDVLLVTAGIHPDMPGHGRVQVATVGYGESDWDNPADRWKGATGQWQAALAATLARTPTPASAPAAASV